MENVINSKLALVLSITYNSLQIFSVMSLQVQKLIYYILTGRKLYRRFQRRQEESVFQYFG